MHELNPVNVLDIDEGKLRQSIDDHLAMIGKDVTRRPGKTSARKVKVEISIAPSYSEEENCLEAVIDWKVDFSMPGKKGSTSKAAIQDGLVLVNPWDRENPMQTVIEEVANPQDEETAEGQGNVEPFPNTAKGAE